MASQRGECDIFSIPAARTTAGTTAAANMGRQPQPAESNAKSSTYDTRIPKEIASCCKITRPPRMLTGASSAM